MENYWLLEQSVCEQIEEASRNVKVPEMAELQAFESSNVTAEGDTPRLLNLAGNVADIKIEGVLTAKPSWFARYYGGGNAAYSEIITALRYAQSDPAITQIQMSINTPGGSVDGFHELIEEMNAATKPIVAAVGSRALSAGFGIASNADKIVAANKSSQFGSVGVAVAVRIREDVIDIASSKAPLKRPDVKTKEGKAVIQSWLNDLHGLFVDVIASGRNTTADKVNTNYGKGGIVLAEKALKVGMIDSILPNQKTTTVAATSSSDTKTGKMDIEQLKADHSDVFNAVLQQGIGQGAKAEQDRVTAHLKMGKSFGAMDIALKAIEEGTELNQSIQADYLSAGRSKQDVDNRQEENPESNAASDGGTDDNKSAESDSVIDMVLEKQGISNE